MITNFQMDPGSSLTVAATNGKSQGLTQPKSIPYNQKLTMLLKIGTHIVTDTGMPGIVLRVNQNNILHPYVIRWDMEGGGFLDTYYTRMEATHALRS